MTDRRKMSRARAIAINVAAPVWLAEYRALAGQA